jgi:hypothetical protein
LETTGPAGDQGSGSSDPVPVDHRQDREIAVEAGAESEREQPTATEDSLPARAQIHEAEYPGPGRWSQGLPDLSPGETRIEGQTAGQGSDEVEGYQAEKGSGLMAARSWFWPTRKRERKNGLRDISEVIREKQAQKAVLEQQISVLMEAIRLMQEDEKMAQANPPTKIEPVGLEAARPSGQGTGMNRWP